MVETNKSKNVLLYNVSDCLFKLSRYSDLRQNNNSTQNHKIKASINEDELHRLDIYTLKL